LHEGQTWTYAFVEEAGPGMKVDIPDVKPDADGKARATVTMTVAAKDDVGVRVDTKRNDNLVFQEWLQLDAHGLTSLQRHVGADTVVLNPAQLMVKWPPKTQLRDYLTRDGTYR
jgi:hypothetical protein